MNAKMSSFGAMGQVFFWPQFEVLGDLGHSRVQT